jgi:modified peptide precursor CbpA
MALGPWHPRQKVTQLFPGGRVQQAWPVNHRRKEDPYMAKESSSKKPISIRYTCAPNGDQVGLSHYLMADAKKAK